MPFTKMPKGKFTNEEKVKMFHTMGATAAVIALVLVILLETGLAGERRELVDMGLTAMIVVLAVSLVGGMYFKK
jgi:heme A synthase